jgi:hypothetical protein
MWSGYDPRWGDDPRSPDVERPDLGRGSRGGISGRDRPPVNPRDVFTERVDLPRGDERLRIYDRDRVYELRGAESRMLATVGAFRVVPASDLRDQHDRPADPRQADLRHLREEGLVRTVTLHGQRRPVVVLTEQGRDLLERRRTPDEGRGQARLAFYAGVRKPRELEHDAQGYRAYLEAAERLQQRGGRPTRVVLDYELKREYQSFLQARNRGRRDSDGEPERDALAIADWARAHELPYFDDRVHIPDVRIEYEDRDGRVRFEDLEVVTPHYRGAHAAAVARAGFSTYRGGTVRLGARAQGGRRGGRGCDPRLAEELL